MLRPGVVGGLADRAVVVTGGAGFIGSSLCRVLLASGARVTAIDNLATGSLANLRTAAECDGRVPEVVVADVRDQAAVGEAMDGADTVFHLACLGVRHSLHAPEVNHDVNAGGALCVLEQARRAGVRRVVHVSSSEVYGDAFTSPMTEDHPTHPHTVYGASKLAGESYALALHRTHGLDVVVLRPFNSYGPRSHAEGDAGEVIPRFIVQALRGEPITVFGSGGQTRDFTHVHDTAATIARAAIGRGLTGRVFNIGSGREVSVNALAGLVLRMTRSSSEIVHVGTRPGDVARLIADSGPAVRELGHRQTVSLQSGLADLIGRIDALDADRFDDLADSVLERNWA
jgi:UDP-glucose 4-epimerase